MIFTSDKDYKSTKKIKQGISRIKDEFEPLAKWIDEKYDVKTLNLIFDFIDNNKSHPRLQVCLEYAKDKGEFMDNRTYNFDKTKQNEIAKKFGEITSNYELKNKPNWIKKLLGLTYKSNNLFVYFSNFETIAKDEANENIPYKEIISITKTTKIQVDLVPEIKDLSGVTVEGEKAEDIPREQIYDFFQNQWISDVSKKT